MALTLALPRKIAFLADVTLSDRRYLGWETTSSTLQYSFKLLDNVARFAVEDAKSGEGYVHIRNLYNNKYWVRKSETDGTIVAGAAKPNEDKESWDCTMFKYEYVDVDGYQHVQFLHVRDNQYVGSKLKKLILQDGGEPAVAKSRIVDYEQVVILPKNVAFKADTGKVYRLEQVDGYPYMEASGEDTAEKGAVHETSYQVHGNYYVKNLKAGKFWRRSPNWIWADTDTDGLKTENLFWPIRVSKNVIALKSLGNNKFIQRLTTEGKDSCLNANVDTIINEARLTVVEPVIARSVRVVKFRMDDARIYDERVEVMGRNVVANSSTSAQSQTLGFKYNLKQTSSWDSSVNVTTALTVNLTSGVPAIGEAEITFSTEIKYEYNWSESVEVIKEVTSSTTAVVPPHTQSEIRLVATVGKCDIPFTYEQTDTLVDGTVKREVFDDGKYTGVNSYNFNYETHETPLPTREWDKAVNIPDLVDQVVS